MSLRKSTIQLLRFPFSFFLLPVYLFAAGQLPEKDAARTALIFIILHLLLYPSSNGYNSYMDRDEGSIGGLRIPLQPSRQLFLASLVMDLLAISLGFFIDRWFVGGMVLYISASRAYSWRGIRLKKYPFTGWLTVSTCQGALVFWLVYHGSHPGLTLNIPVPAMLASSLLVGGFYPLTQVYQHDADRLDGVRTISSVLGIRGTFIFTAVVYFLAFGVLAYYFISSLEIKEFYVLATCMLPIVVYFLSWMVKVWSNPGMADFSHTMRMNWLAATCINAGFAAVWLMQ